MNIFNLSLLYGDSFLHDESPYFLLFYEVLRNHDLFQTLNNKSKKPFSFYFYFNFNKLNNLVNAPIVTNNESEAPQGSSSKETPLLNLSNINLVHSHFTSKLETFQSSQTLSTEFVIFRFYFFFLSTTQKIIKLKLNQIQIIRLWKQFNVM